MDAELIALTAMIDQAYEGTKRQADEMVTEVRKQISEGLGRDDIIAGHMLFLTVRYDAMALATLIALLTYEQAKADA